MIKEIVVNIYKAMSLLVFEQIEMIMIVMRINNYQCLIIVHLKYSKKKDYIKMNINLMFF